MLYYAMRNLLEPTHEQQLEQRETRPSPAIHPETYVTENCHARYAAQTGTGTRQLPLAQVTLLLVLPPQEYAVAAAATAQSRRTGRLKEDDEPPVITNARSAIAATAR